MEILISVRRLYISFKSPVNDFVYSFGRAALLLLVEVQNHTVPVRERRRIRVNVGMVNRFPSLYSSSALQSTNFRLEIHLLCELNASQNYSKRFIATFPNSVSLILRCILINFSVSSSDLNGVNLEENGLRLESYIQSLRMSGLSQISRSVVCFCGFWKF